MTLANQRFVPIYFDLGARGPAYDANAKSFVVELDSRLGGSSVPTPDVIVASASGEELGKVSNYAAEEQVLVMLRKVLAEAQLAGETDEEAGWDTPRRAWLRYCVGDVEHARALLEEPKDSSAALMLARIERWEGNLDAAQDALGSVERIDSGDLSAELGRIELAAGNLEASLAAFEGVPHDHEARSEVDYRRGVVLYQLGHTQAAKAVWFAMVERFGEDRWSYRADWALAGANEPKGKRKTSFSTGGKKTALGRHGYMGRRNPDLGD